MKADVILGLQWGDEGKGKIVDLLTPDYDIIARFQGGPNAGHTIHFGEEKHVLHLIPSGIFHPGITNLIGNGVIIDPWIFSQELMQLRAKGLEPEKQLLISDRAHLILPTHRLLDLCQEKLKQGNKIGSTLKGIGPSYTDKAARNGIRTGEIFSFGFKEVYQRLRAYHLHLISSYGMSAGDLLIDGIDLQTYENKWFEAIETLRQLTFIQTELYLNEALAAGKRVLAEGAQGTLLDIDFGSYPYVTSSNTTVGGVLTGLGIPASRIGKVYGVFKAYCTRVGNGPFPTELQDETGVLLRDRGNEYGSTTGRSRRCGWLDLPALKYALMINGADELIMMKADVMDTLDEIRVCTAYRLNGREYSILPSHSCTEITEPVYTALQGWKTDISSLTSWTMLPQSFQNYLDFIEKEMKSKISVLSLGPERNQTLRINT